MDNFRNHLRSLVQLAIADQSFHDREKTLIYSIGKAHGIPEEEIDDLIREIMTNKGHYEISFTALSYDEKFEYLYNIIQLMKIDSKVFLSEIKFCEENARKLGFSEKVVSRMSKQVYSDPSITANVEALKNAMKKFEL